MKPKIWLMAILFTLAAPSLRASGWKIVASPNVGTQNNFLASVSAAADNDVWAVGSEYSAQLSADQTLIEHWNGRRWSVVTSPNASSGVNILYGVTVAAADDVWAVGTQATSSSTFDTLIEHWNGSAWSIVPSPNLDNGTENVLEGVTVISPNDVWAVGYSRVDAEFVFLTLHWNGTAWSVVPALPGEDEIILTAVSGLASNDVWAAGVGTDDLTPLAIHWDGTQWNVVATPQITYLPSGLYGIVETGPGNVWSVGANGKNATLNLFLNSGALVEAPTPRFPAGDTYGVLFGIVARASDNIWSVGAILDGNFDQPFAEHWNGTKWRIVATPVVANANTGLASVTATPKGTLWAVGNTTPANQSERTFILRKSR